MGSLVLELQKEVMKEDCDVLNLLRKAHLIAAKLDLKQFDEWIKSELNGYRNDNYLTPKYRCIIASLNEWIPFVGWHHVDNRQIEEMFCTIEIKNSIGWLVELGKKHKELFQIYSFDQDNNSRINSLRGMMKQQTKYSLYCSVLQIKSIIEHVKNTILDWTIKLEKTGIFGEEMQFNSVEKESAKQIPQQITNYNYYGSTNVIRGDAQNSVFVAGNENTIKYTIENANKAISEIESSLNKENIPFEDKETAMEMITEIKEKVSQNKKPSIVKSALVGLLEFVGEVGASLTAALIQSKIQGLF